MILLASLFANSTVPLSPAMGPSTLLPSHDQTTFHDCPAASTPGIAVVAGRTGSAGAALVFSDWTMGIPKGFGATLHFATTFFIPGFCQFCRLLPRGNDDDGLCAKTTPAAQAAITARAMGNFICRSRSIATMVFCIGRLLFSCARGASRVWLYDRGIFTCI